MLPIAFIRDRWLLRVGLYVALVFGIVGVELVLQNLEISRCAELGVFTECVEKHRSVDDLLQNGGGVAVLALPLLFSAKRMWNKLDAWGAKARYPDDASFQRKLNIAAAAGITGAVVAPVAWIVWLATVGGSHLVRTVSGVAALVGVVVFVAMSALMLAWRRKYVPR